MRKERLWFAVVMLIAAILLLILGGCNLLKTRAEKHGVIEIRVEQPSGPGGSSPARVNLVRPSQGNIPLTPLSEQSERAVSKMMNHVFPAEGDASAGFILTADTGTLNEDPARVLEGEAIKESAQAEKRQPMLWAAIGLLVVGLLTATLLHYPTPGGLLALSGLCLYGLYEYPWLSYVAIGLTSAALAIYVGYEVAEKRHKKEMQ
jgi:hypothetical protein